MRSPEAESPTPSLVKDEDDPAIPKDRKTLKIYEVFAAITE